MLKQRSKYKFRNQNKVRKKKIKDQALGRVKLKYKSNFK